jgi:phage terminase Nu1 subunit (DNA packaging protein)
LADFQADVQQLKGAQMRAELLPAAEAVSAWQAAIGRCRSLVLGVPTGSAATIVLLARSRDAEEATHEVREHLTKLLDHALNELADLSFDDDELEEAQEANGRLESDKEVAP